MKKFLLIPLCIVHAAAVCTGIVTSYDKKSDTITARYYEQNKYCVTFIKKVGSNKIFTLTANYYDITFQPDKTLINYKIIAEILQLESKIPHSSSNITTYEIDTKDNVVSKKTLESYL